MVRDSGATIGSAFRRVVEGAQIPAVLKHGDGCYIYANTAAAQLLGYSADEFNGLMITELCPSDPVLIMRALDELKLERVWSAEVPMRQKSGRLVRVVCQAFAHTDDDGSVVYGCVFSPVREEERCSATAPDYGLTPAELCLARLMLEGFSEEEIASLRGAGLQEVKGEVASLIVKMRANSRTQACVLGIKAGLAL
jgi:PAS domain S-box-containing protein